MSLRSNLTLDVLHHIVEPLTATIFEVRGYQRAASGQTDQSLLSSTGEEAETFTKLLEIAANLSTKISVAAGITYPATEGEDYEATRYALLQIAIKLLTQYYRSTGQIPGEADQQRIIDSLGPVQAVSNSFPALEFKRQDHKALSFIEALAPVVSAVAAFSFGKSEPLLIQEITSRLKAASEKVAQKLSGSEKSLTGDDVLAALADLYCKTHEAETARLMSLDEAARAKVFQEGSDKAMEAIWKTFDLRVSMLDVVIETMKGGASTQAQAVAPAPQSTAGASAENAQPPSFAGLAKPENPPASDTESDTKDGESEQQGTAGGGTSKGQAGPDTPSETPAEAAPAQANPANPMGFFKPGGGKMGGM